MDGSSVGLDEGCIEGSALGWIVGCRDGPEDGRALG